MRRSPSRRPVSRFERICSGAPGRVFEVTRDGNIVWEYLNPYGGELDQGQGGNSPANAEGTPSASAPAPSDAASNEVGVVPGSPDAKKAVEIMGLGDTKAADPKTNPLENDLDDLLDDL